MVALPCTHRSVTHLLLLAGARGVLAAEAVEAAAGTAAAPAVGGMWQETGEWWLCLTRVARQKPMRGRTQHGAAAAANCAQHVVAAGTGAGHVGAVART